jgi:hypothetical protein
MAQLESSAKKSLECTFVRGNFRQFFAQVMQMSHFIEQLSVFGIG